MNQQLWTDVLKEWGRALLNTPQLLHRIAFRARTIDDELTEATLKGSLRRALDGIDLLALGLGMVIGSGVFVLTGPAAAMTGPAVVVSYLLSGIAATLGACCYAEFSMDYPVAGAGFTYIMITFGELPAWITVTNLLMEYVVGTAAIARAFSIYLARTIWQQNPSDLSDGETIDEHFLVAGQVDFMAFGIVLLLTALLSSGVKESAMLVTGLVILHMIGLGVIVIAAFTQASSSNLTTFLVGGPDNMFTAAAHLFFAYTGFDVVASAAEESVRPENVPKGLIGTVVITTATYILMSLSLVLMASCSELAANPETSFPSAFLLRGMTGMYYVTNISALVGIVTSMLVGLYGTARLAMVAARDWLLPPFLATVYPRTQTPLIAQIVFGVVTAGIALACTFTTLSDLVSIATTLVLCLVANALLFRRYYPGLPRLRFSKWGTVEAAEGKSMAPVTVPGARLSLPLWARQWMVLGHMALINGLCFALTIYYQTKTESLAGQCTPTDSGTAYQSTSGLNINFDKNWAVFIVLWALWLGATLSMQLLCPLEYEPPKWHIPWWLMPWLPSCTILLMVFTIGSLEQTESYAIFGMWIAGTLVVYLLFSLPMSYIKHYKLDYTNTEQFNVVELSFQEGRWQEAKPAHGTALNGGVHLGAKLSHLGPARLSTQLPSGYSEMVKLRGSLAMPHPARSSQRAQRLGSGAVGSAGVVSCSTLASSGQPSGSLQGGAGEGQPRGEAAGGAGPAGRPLQARRAASPTRFAGPGARRQQQQQQQQQLSLQYQRHQPLRQQQTSPPPKQ